MAVLVPFYLSMYNNIIEVIFMTNIDQLDKILQSLNTELQKNKIRKDYKVLTEFKSFDAFLKAITWEEDSNA